MRQRWFIGKGNKNACLCKNSIIKEIKMATNRTIIHCCICLVWLLFSNNLFGAIKLPAIFSDGMVLQQKSNVALWGWADAGEVVTIKGNWPSGKSYTTKTDTSGKWMMQLPTPGAGGPYLLFFSGTNRIEIKDVLVGEVWLCSGQSNMGFSLKSAYRAEEEIASADFPSIRYFNVKRQYGPQEFDDCPGSAWTKTSPQTAGGFSAVAYFFAKKIYQELHVPVGLVYAAWGGTPAEAWTPMATLKNDDSLQMYIRRWKEMFLTVGQDSAAYHLALEKWEQVQKSADSNRIKKPQEPGTLISYNRPWREPSVLFNGMIHPVVPYGIKGVLWYQGESNVNSAGEYFHLFSNMIAGWRKSWDNQKLPFYFVQIAPFAYNDLDAAARLQQAQSEVAAKIPYTGMAATIDVGNMKNQHPVHKKEVGDRLALIALNKLYGHKNLVFTGPVVKEIKVQKGKLELDFDREVIVNSLHASSAFEIGYKTADRDMLIFVPAQFLAEGKKIIVWNDSVLKPAAVRYAWLKIANANLAGKEGLPVTLFFNNLSK
jgi:sialate O-acetylesterase